MLPYGWREEPVAPRIPVEVARQAGYFIQNGTI